MNFLDTSKLTSFEPSEFYSETFSVDEFIQRKRYSVPLDVLRDDLGLHLKSLRSSLIELINQDYGQFVNLSSNLVGLDGKIQNITGPLTRAQNDLQNLQQLLMKTLEILGSELEERRSIRGTLSQVQLLRRVHHCLDSSERYLEKCSSEIKTIGDFTSLKVACDKVVDTRQLMQKCLPSPLVDKLRDRWESCSTNVLRKLESIFRAYADDTLYQSTKDTHTVEDEENDRVVVVQSILFMYFQLQAQRKAELIFINEILKPKCDIVLSQKGNISSLFSEIEDFIEKSPVLHVSRELERCPWVKDYDFLSSGIFPHVVSILMKQFPHIWSASTPDTFHSNWIRCSSFIDAVENAFPSLDHLHQFRHSVALKEFNDKWQFNVYFQLRFHSLAIEMECALDSLHSRSPTPDFKLDCTRILIKVINQCWDKDKIFILQLSGRFLKASALFISRFLKEVNMQVASNPEVTLDQLIFAYADLTLSELIIRQILTDKVNSSLAIISSNPILSSTTPDQSVGENNMIESPGAKFLSMFNWDGTREALEARLVDLTLTQCISFISSVNEVPRLFRRTNRDVPSKPSEYVNGILEPIQTLQISLKDAKQEDLLERVGIKIGQQVMQRYKAQMEEVLTSVQRMEESLKRLKKVKGQNQVQPPKSNNESDIKSNNSNPSDDDKIRRQIQIDFDYLSDQIRIFTLI